MTSAGAETAPADSAPPLTDLQKRFRDYAREKGIVNYKQTCRELHIDEDQWIDLVALFTEKGTIHSIGDVNGYTAYGFVKPRATGGGRERQLPPEKTVAGAGSLAPPRGSAQGVTVRASRPQGAADRPGLRRAQMAAGKARKGRRGAK